MQDLAPFLCVREERDERWGSLGYSVNGGRLDLAHAHESGSQHAMAW